MSLVSHGVFQLKKVDKVFVSGYIFIEKNYSIANFSFSVIFLTNIRKETAAREHLFFIEVICNLG